MTQTRNLLTLFFLLTLSGLLCAQDEAPDEGATDNTGQESSQRPRASTSYCCLSPTTLGLTGPRSAIWLGFTSASSGSETQETR